MCANRSMPSRLLALLNVIFLFHCLQKRQFELIISSLIVFLYVNADRILSKMGEGTFGQVLECWDLENQESVAIKIVRSLQKYREAAMIEIDVLQRLGKHDFTGSRCVQIRNWFDYRNHICIVFEKLGPSLYDFLRKNSYRSFPIDLVREFARQILESVTCEYF
uniref:Protein kinase domain-containing protein n=1 Tax=Aegilops tauschii subsp. strangulata TaxID=200361 RepID=A0A453P6W8_AEGTS